MNPTHNMNAAIDSQMRGRCMLLAAGCGFKKIKKCGNTSIGGEAGNGDQCPFTLKARRRGLLTG